MKAPELALLGLLATTAGCAEKQEPGSSEPYQPYESGSDGTGGGSEDRPSDEALLHQYARDHYSYALGEAMSGNYEYDSWQLYPGEEEEINVYGNVDLMLDIPFTVEEFDYDKEVSVAFGLVEDCDFTHGDAVMYPLDVVAPFEITELSGGDQYYYSVDFDEAMLDCDSDAEQVGVLAVPFVYSREGNSIVGVRAIPTLSVTCVKDGEVDYAFPVE